jgi:hypothetical protein
MENTKFIVGHRYRSSNNKGGYIEHSALAVRSTLVGVDYYQWYVRFDDEDKEYPRIPEYYEDITFTSDKITYQDLMNAAQTLANNTIAQACIGINTESDTMELKDIKTANLIEAKEQFEKERMNEEVAYAKQQLAYATNNLNRLDREIKNLEEQKKPYTEIVKQFE